MKLSLWMKRFSLPLLWTVAQLLIGLFAGFVHMSLGILIHEASILAVIFNAMRLLIPPGAEKKRRK